MERTTVFDNFTEGAVSDGAGVSVFNRSSGAGLVELINSTVTRNVASGAFSVGGGVVASLATDAKLTHVTMSENTSAGGTSGIHLTTSAGRELVIENSLVLQSGADETACDADNIVATHTLATDDSCTGKTTPLADIELDPRLINHGGGVFTHALGDVSVAINAAGDCVDELGIEQDQRGRPRPGAGSAACDIGAYEFQRDDSVFSDRFEAE